MRILVTGSRKWESWPDLETALVLAAGDEESVTVVHGDNGSGADMIADRIARLYGFHVEPHHADWQALCRDTCKRGHRKRRADGTEYCPAAGNYRNQEMVDAGADICLAFYQPGAANIGTGDCVKRATRAGIRIRPYGRD